MTLDETRMERLAFIRYLHREAVEQSKKPQPMCSASILTFHDAVELFLQLAGEHLDATQAGNSNVNFMEYWGIIKNQLPEDETLGQKSAMRRLNDARVGLKHHGTRPDVSDIESFRAGVNNFFEENTPLVFDIDYSGISMLQLVEYEDIRSDLEEAQELMEQEDLEEARDKTAIAFKKLVTEYESEKSDDYGKSPFAFGGGFGLPQQNFNRNQQALSMFVSTTIEAIEDLRQAMKILSLDIDYRRYSKFYLLTPSVSEQVVENEYELVAHDDVQVDASEENVRFCIDFVVETAIHLQNFDFTLEIEDMTGSALDW